MPIYEYECKKCGRIIEELQSFSDPPLKKCKHCKGKLEKLISLSSFQLTGTGWYSTDYVKGPGIPPKAEDQKNPAIDGDTNGSGKDNGKATVVESGPSSPTEKFKSIQKDTKNAKSKAKTA
ncbi:MAG: zinc ribbon domain-containing protein [Deltaproteobacteria bacterium]|nr:zinc ribbon domain-containing protein [Deltaproteobacteria bacterium]